jgi:CDGSH-type Zn-finger protein
MRFCQVVDYPILNNESDDYFCGKRRYMAAKLTINSNGSVRVEGDFEIVDMQGNNYGLQGRTVVSICRCGLSANKPFCDGSHKGHFEHDAQAFDLPPKKV